jgi:DNA invertase Pin-like site-specific DNA recombinase
MADRKRCAIYTRKSTEEGLEQAFNSLDAQREACAAYILSQAHEGWEPVRDLYDDGGWSGGNLERPALKQLLQDVEAGRVDVIVVYKVDRLTRSLADFARIVDVLDKAGASFVSVTQAFNTTTSMGRLTLNVLLSFAQFEREVTGERIRDKIAASKRKGMWMGGPVPIGYRLEDRRLAIEPSEASIVRLIFERYVALRSIGDLVDELAERGIRTKKREFASGKTSGGGRFTRGPLASILRNPIYLGKVHHKGELFEGQHDAIIDAELWEQVQQIRIANGSDRRAGKRLIAPSLLTGMLTDPDGNPMTPSHAVKGSRRYRYYLTRQGDGASKLKPWRAPAGELDRVIIRQLSVLLQATASDCLAEGDEEQFELQTELAKALPTLTVPEQRTIALEHGLSVRLAETAIRISIGTEVPIESELPARLTRRGYELRIAIAPDGAEQIGSPDPVLLRLVAHASAAQKMVVGGEPQRCVSKYGRRHLWQLLRISWLAPDILSAMVEGRQPAELTGRRLLRATNIPLDWASQRSFFGFA